MPKLMCMTVPRLVKPKPLTPTPFKPPHQHHATNLAHRRNDSRFMISESTRSSRVHHTKTGAALGCNKSPLQVKAIKTTGIIKLPRHDPKTPRGRQVPPLHSSRKMTATKRKNGHPPSAQRKKIAFPLINLTATVKDKTVHARSNRG